MPVSHQQSSRLSSSRPGTRPLAWLVLVAAVLQVAAPAITIIGPGTSPGGGSGPDLLVTPAGWAFSIWGVIYALALAQAVAVLAVDVSAVPWTLQVAQLSLYLGGTAWIAMAALDSSTATALALAVMLGAAVRGVTVAARRQVAPPWLALLTRTATGLYAGWVTAAFFLNVSTALVDAGVVEPDALAWQLVILAVAVAVLLAVLVAARGVPAYAAAGIWALAGIAAANLATTSVLVVTVVSAALLVAVAVGIQVSGRTVGPTSEARTG